MKRLDSTSLNSLPRSVIRPGYDRSAVTPGIVHLGVGAFHRAHQAVMVEDRLAAGETGWGIVAASLRAADTAEALNPQNGLYTLGVRDGSGTQLRVIGAISEVIVATSARERLLAAMTDPRVCIVSLTVTEKGYCHDPATGALNETHPGIIADLANPHRPATAPGLVVEALARRRAEGTEPFTVLCCDNLPSNGVTVRRVVSRFGALRDPELGEFIAGEVAFPATMVDRIVPATTDEDRAMVAATLGVRDAWPVMSEPFTQWVIEDRFPAGRPRFEDAGAEITTDVAPYERMKLRLLNGTHSTMAYLGQLAGLETIADTISTPTFARFIRRLMDEEITPTVPGFSEDQLTRYKDALITRYANPALRHRTAQIAMDGSQKLPQRLIGTMRDQLAAGRSIALLGLAVAGFIRFMTGTGERGSALPINDPMAATFSKAVAEAGAAGITRLPGDQAEALAERLAGSVLTITDVFGETGRDSRVRSAVTKPLARLFSEGALATVTTA
ncbi:MAG: mannitol dehydrogenase family protein [Proteobacteria bacterium]|nr:mannitol dehydrogenase family protein [Pseudomonadota bacterium]